MKVVAIVLVVFLSLTSKLHGQLNEYKYIVVPKKFDGFSKENQYKTSTLVKHLFTQNGFTVVYDDGLPADLRENRCLGLYVGLIDESSMFTTKTALTLKDCDNAEIFTTAQGRSKSKAYETAFSEAINQAFKSFNGVNYSYKPKQEAPNNEVLTVSYKNDVKQLDETPKDQRGQNPLVQEEFTKENQLYKDNRPVDSAYEKASPQENTTNTIQQKATRDEQSYTDSSPAQSAYTKPSGQANARMDADPRKVKVLYAQEITNGYQLVDSDPKIVMKLLKSTSPNVYIAESGNLIGVVYSEAGKWYFEYYQGDQLVSEELGIKF